MRPSGLLYPCIGVLALLAGCASAPLPRALAAYEALVQISGRALREKDGWQVTWPAVQWRTDFSGTSIGVETRDVARYHVEIDGLMYAPVPASPQRQTTWYRGLRAGAHRIEVIRMSATPKAAGNFYGFVPGDGGHWLQTAMPSHRQLLVLGDSGVTGYGSLSTMTDCDAGVQSWTDASQSFAVIAARALHADWQLNGVDGIGIVRNWHGIWPGTSYSTYAGRTLQSDVSSTYSDTDWHPQVVLIDLGGNDFSTPPGADEPWSAETLRAAVEQSYVKLIAQQRRELGAGALIILQQDSNAPAQLVELLAGQVAAAQARHDERLVLFKAPQVERSACDYHPNVAAHRQIAAALVKFIDEHHGYPVN